MDCNSHFISDVCIANYVLGHSPTFANRSDGTDILSYMFSKGCSAENNDFPAICTVRPYIFKWFTMMMIKMMTSMMMIMMMVNMTMMMVRTFAQFGRISSNGSQ